jgi:hypothetical protein
LLLRAPDQREKVFSKSNAQQHGAEYCSVAPIYNIARGRLRAPAEN